MILSSKNMSRDYEVAKLITKTNFGRVFKVKHKPSGSFRCLKLYVKDKMKATVQNDFLSELEILKSLDHPHIFKVLEFAEEEKNFFLISEFLEGGDLFDAISRAQTFKEQDAKPIIWQILITLNYLHVNQIAHRDLKPENIMLSLSGRLDLLKVIDFGTAKRFKPETKMTEFLGTAYYMAPELFLNSYDQKIDVWSCGVILFILLSGMPPFNGHSNEEIYQNIQKSPVSYADPIWKSLSAHAHNLLQNMLNKDPKERFSVAQCLSHPWFSTQEESAISDSLLHDYLRNVREFTACCKMAKTFKMFVITHDTTSQIRQDLEKIFERLDTNHDGAIDSEELKAACSKTDEALEFSKILEEVDINNDGKINFSEFLMCATKFHRDFLKEKFGQVFALMDKNRDGRVSLEEMTNFFRRPSDDEFLKRMLLEMDVDKDGFISPAEFLACCVQKISF